MRLHHRTYRVQHGREGFSLCVSDEWIPAILAEFAVNRLLDVLGHPCCDAGPLARLTIRYRTLRRFGISFGQPDTDDDWDLDQDENAMGLFWHRVLNLPNTLVRREKYVTAIPLTDEQALTVRPGVANWDFVWNRDDESEDEQ